MNAGNDGACGGERSLMTEQIIVRSKEEDSKMHRYNIVNENGCCNGT